MSVKKGWYRGGEPRVVRLAVELDGLCKKLSALIRWDEGGSADQLERSGASVLSNTGEGLDGRLPGQQRQSFGHARASAGEVERILRGLERERRYPDLVARGLVTCRDLKMDLHRLIRWTHRTPQE